MSVSFVRIVRNYEKLFRVGQEIINHKDFVRKADPKKLDEEFKKQEERIEIFAKEAENAHIEWKKNPYSTNPYWTGLS